MWRFRSKGLIVWSHVKEPLKEKVRLQSTTELALGPNRVQTLQEQCLSGVASAERRGVVDCIRRAECVARLPQSLIHHALHRTKWMTGLDEVFDIDAKPAAAITFRSFARARPFAESTSEIFRFAREFEVFQRPARDAGIKT